MWPSYDHEMVDAPNDPTTTTTFREPSPAERVFRIPELLETILLNLGTKDLLLSQRTSRAFRYTTEGSVRLRRKLFLEPQWNLEGRVFDAWSNNNRPGRKPENNRLLLRAFPGCYPTITLVIVNDGSGQGQVTSSEEPSARSEQWSWDVCISFPADQAPMSSPAVNYPEASWRKMYLSQPPCTNLHLVRRWQRSMNPAIVRPDGITMGDFFEEVTKDTPGCEDRKWHESYISSDRDWHFEGNLRCNTIAEQPIPIAAPIPAEQIQREVQRRREEPVHFQTLLHARGVEILLDEDEDCYRGKW